MKLVLMMGRTAAGKTTLSRYLAARLSARYISEAALKRALIQDQDYRVELSLDETLRDLGYSAAAAVARECITRGESVILDAAYHRRERRRHVFENIAHPQRELWVIYCRCGDEHETRRRIEARVHAAPGPFTQANSYAIFEHIDRTFEEVEASEFSAANEGALLLFDSANNSFELRSDGGHADASALMTIMQDYVRAMNARDASSSAEKC